MQKQFPATHYPKTYSIPPLSLSIVLYFKHTSTSKRHDEKAARRSLKNSISRLSFIAVQRVGTHARAPRKSRKERRVLILKENTAGASARGNYRRPWQRAISRLACIFLRGGGRLRPFGPFPCLWPRPRDIAARRGSFFDGYAPGMMKPSVRAELEFLIKPAGMYSG